MGRNIYMLLVLFVLAACSQKEISENINIKVTLGSRISSRTALAPGREKLLWEAGDRVGIYHDAAGVQNTVLEYTGDEESVVALPASSTQIYSLFPYSGSAGDNPGGLSVTIPAVQVQDTPGVLDGSRWPMSAMAEIRDAHADLVFSPMAALWALNIYSTDPQDGECVSSVKITPTMNAGFCGEALVDVTSSSAAFSEGDSSEASLELTVSNPKALVRTKPENNMLFEDQLYVVLARQAYKSVKFEIRTTAGRIYTLVSNSNEFNSVDNDVMAININLSKGTITASASFGTEEMVEEDYTYSSLEEVVRDVVVYDDITEDIIPDFSRVGYHYGDDEIPYYENIIATLSPTGDRTDRSGDIQAAIDAADGSTNSVVLLNAGDYYIGKTIRIEKSHVVLRGKGMGEGGTRLIATDDTGDMAACVRVGVSGNPSVVDGSSATPVAESYVPVGRLSLSVEDASAFSVGDRVFIYRPATARWLHDIRMDAISDGENWDTNQAHLNFERTITGITGNRITLDAPIVMAMDEYYGGGYVVRMYRDRIVESGLEDLALVSEFDASKTGQGNSYNPAYFGGIYYNDEDHCKNAVQVMCAEHCWVKSVSGRHFVVSCVELGTGSKNVTVLDCHSYDPVGKISGSRRYAFSANNKSTMGLFKKCSAEFDRHQFVTTQFSTGPLVFTDCTATNCFGETGPHCFWAVGVLYDYIRVDTREISVQDSDYVGTGASHGWQGANHVLWNCEAPKIICQSPWVAEGRNPTGRNYCIGCIGKKVLSTTIPPSTGSYLTNRLQGEWYPDPGEGRSNAGHVTSGTYYGVTANGLSLYEALLAERKAAGIRAIPAEWYE